MVLPVVSCLKTLQETCHATLPHPVPCAAGDLLGVCGKRKTVEMLNSDFPAFSKVSPVVSMDSDIGLVCT